jgi:hypothetical protein
MEFKKNYMLIILILIATGVLVFTVDRFMRKENFESYTDEIKQLAREADIAKDVFEHQDVSQENIAEQQQDVVENVKETQELLAEYDNLKPEELLPTDEEADEWSKVNPKGTGSLELKNFLEAGFHLGVDTQANTLRNANQQVRSEPPNPQLPVSVWMNSTIAPDQFRKPLEVGEN